MIEKLDKYLAKNINSCNMSQNVMVAHKAIEKINELVDAVNELQKQIDKVSCAILDLATINGKNKALESIKAESKTPVDPYAEQRKWIGKLCCFWDNNIGEKVWGILGGIDYSENEKYPYFCDQLQEQYQCCEPVKPDDDIIYKGGDNE